MSEYYFELRAGQDLLAEEIPVEIVERKGKGHPDSLCDGASEELSVALSEIYRQETGKILHHNVDKAVLVGGHSRCDFGGGQIIEPINLYIVGRASKEVDGKKLINEAKLEDKIRGWMMGQVPHLKPENFNVKLLIRSGSDDLVSIFSDNEQPPRANDTSLAVGYAPLSELEKLVFETEKFLNSSEGKQKWPALGEDIKVMGVRKEELITLTIAAAFVASEVPDRKTYDEIKNQIERYLKDEFVGRYTDRKVEVIINNADTKKTAYLTVTGTSAESGDDGQVGRGNRANGLITPYRPMSLEAVAGKNPVSHVGKIYSIMSQLIANRIVTQLPEVKQVYVYMVSKINDPITQPQALNVELWGLDVSKAKNEIKKIADEVLGSWREIRDGFIARRWPIY
ncbi:MAG: methionine adenosyltransferase [Candidatus Saccharicenans sp.]|nr:MAG: S-adenosylmethionine synthase [Candidatus Aminicenantes bacterium]HEK85327.1 methionine adenosyltransferase [Candidatus Aminicenantes bacterium]